MPDTEETNAPTALQISAPSPSVMSAEDNAFRLLQHSSELSTVLESITDAFYSLDRDWRFTYVNAEAERLLEHHREDLYGQVVWQLFPQALRSTFGYEYQRAMETGTPVSFETYYPPHDRWYDVRAYPSAAGLFVYFHDVTQRHHAESCERFLHELTDRTRGLLDPDEALAECLQMTGEFLQARRVLYAEIDTTTGNFVVRHVWQAGDMSPLPPIFPPSVYSQPVQEILRAGEVVTSEDIPSDIRFSEQHETLAAMGARSLLIAPITKEGEWAGVFAVSFGHQHRWTTEEVDTLRSVSDRARLTVEHARLYRSLRQEVDERRRIEAERERLLTELFDSEARLRLAQEAAGFGTYDYDIATGYVVLDDRARTLFCLPGTATRIPIEEFRASVHPGDHGKIGREMERALRPETGGTFRIEFRTGGQHDDGRVCWIAAAGHTIFSPEGTPLRMLGMLQDITERREAEAKREAFVARQERIAETLQRSLLLAPMPDAFPGVTVKPLYQSASDDTLVGGDFYDIFALDSNSIALVVGDVTGKGLEAATYTAELKFALRAFLRENPDPASALHRLNHFVRDAQRFDASHLGADYAVAAVVVVDTRTGETVCSSAGMESPLLLRAATREAHAIAVSGMILGAMDEANYPARRDHLEAGDLLVLYTDGITEARHRGRFFGQDGLIRTLQDIGHQDSLADVGLEVARRAKAFAGGRQQDDICLLLARKLSVDTAE